SSDVCSSDLKDDGLNVPPKQEGRRIRHHQTRPYETRPCLSWKQPHPRKGRATLMQHIGDRIREYRMLHGLTQEDLAEKAGMHPTTIKKLEQAGTARMDTLHRIARPLNTTTDSLITSRPRPLEHRDDGRLDLLAPRRTASPPHTLDGVPQCADTDPPHLPPLQYCLIRLDAAYPGDRYSDLAEILPRLSRSAHTAVPRHPRTPRGAEARRLRS